MNALAALGHRGRRCGAAFERRLGRCRAIEESVTVGAARDKAAVGTVRTDHADGDSGRALIEVVFLAVLILIPTVYILASVMRIQAATFAVTQGARDAGRVMDAAPTVSDGVARAEEIARLALTDQRVPAEDMRVRFVSTGSDCVSGREIVPSLRPGDVYDVCVVAVVSFPGVPSVVTGSQNTVSGVFTLHVGDFREGS